MNPRLRRAALGTVIGLAATRVAAIRGLPHRSAALMGFGVAGAALVGATRVLPVKPVASAQGRRVWTPANQMPSPDGEGLAVVVNPKSGSVLSADPSKRIGAALPAAAITELDDDADLAATLRDLARDAVAVGVAGGDGSVSAAAAIAVENDVPLAPFPAGTLNHFARELGAATVDDAIEAVESGHAVAVDVATIDGRHFLNNASFGTYVDLVDVRESLERKIGKWPAAVIALVIVLLRSERLEVELDGRRRTLWMGFIGNCVYRPDGFVPRWRERLDDGLLDIRIVDASRRWSRARVVLSVLTGRLARSRVYEQWHARALTVRSADGPLRLAADGETFEGPAEFIVQKHERRLVVFAPEEK